MIHCVTWQPIRSLTPRATAQLSIHVRLMTVGMYQKLLCPLAALYRIRPDAANHLIAASMNLPRSLSWRSSSTVEISKDCERDLTTCQQSLASNS